MDGYWQMLVDLSTVGEAVSDLALQAKLNEDGGSRLEIECVYVP
jgi:hypothetical protein